MLGLIAGIFILMSLLRSYITSHLFISTVNKLHYLIVYHVLRSPVKLQDPEFSRKLLLKLKIDIGILDNIAPINYNELVAIFFQILGGIITICVIDVWMAIPLVVFLFFMIRVSRRGFNAYF